MKYFSFNSDIFDFWPIYDSIRQYYPIGIKKDQTKSYYDFEGTKQKEKLLIEYIHNRKNYESNWAKFCGEIAQHLELELKGTTMGQEPSLSAAVMLRQEVYPSVIHTKELHFAISLLGPFYQIYGKDTTVILEPGTSAPLSASTVNLLTPSPIGEFKEVFAQVEDFIKKKYPDYKIVPFFLCRLFIEGLQVSHSDEDVCTVNQALFNNYLSSCRNVGVRNDQKYGLPLWKKKGVEFDDGGLIF